MVDDPDTVYFCVDLEASGPAPGLYDMVSVGGVVVRFDGTRHVRGAGFYHELIPIFEGWSDEAEGIHRLSRAHLKAHGMPPKEALRRITEFVKAEAGDKRPLFVGHNAPFDWMFVAWYFAWAELPNPFGYNALDTKALFMGVSGLPWKQTNKERLLVEYPQLIAPPPEKVHDALVDAEFQADILIALLDHGR